MPLSSTKMEYWCLFKGNQLALVQNIGNIANGQQGISRVYKIWDDPERIVYCAELGDPPPSQIAMDSFLPLKKALDKLEPKWFGLATKAYSILNWDRNHQFCSKCGSTLQDCSNELRFERECVNCHLIFYPRISPSVIVRIRKDDHILMARSAHFPPGAYGLIAGFVEAGESLEEALYREVQEEVGIKITNVCYYGSQPWPFPDSLMVAYTADYQSGELVIDNTELEHAGWYRYDQLPGKPSTQISIASQLIEDFVHGFA